MSENSQLNNFREHDNDEDIFYDADFDDNTHYLQSLCEECSISESRINKIRQLILPHIVDDLTIVRFFIGNDLSINTTAQKIKEDIEWRNRIKPDKIKRSNILTMINSGEVVELNMPDKNGYPVVYIRARMHKAYKYPSTANYYDFMYYTIEKLLQSHVRVSAVVDLNDLGWRNLDIPLIIDVIKIYNNHYPERLGDLIFISGEFWFEYGFKLSKNLLGPRTLPRVHYMKSVHEIETLINVLALPQDCSIFNKSISAITQ